MRQLVDHQQFSSSNFKIILIIGPTIPHASAAVPNFNVGAVGDWGCNNTNTVNTVNNIRGKSTERTLGLGDNSYVTTEDCWFQITSPLDSQMKTAIGNHDTDSTTKLSQLMNHYGMSQQYYAFTYQNIRFIVLATETDYAVGSAQYNFALNELKKASSDPAIQWIIVDFHRISYTSPNPAGQPVSSFRK